MIDTVRLYKMPPWQAMRFHYVRNGSQTVIENYFYKEYLSVRHPDELDFNITLPDIDDPDAVNVAKVGDKWYEIADNIDTTRNDMSVTFVLRFDPFLTYWKSNNETTKPGIWEKLPYADSQARLPTVLDDSNLIESRVDSFNVMECETGDKTYDMLWVEITTSCELYGGFYPSYPGPTYNRIGSVHMPSFIEGSVTKQSELYKYGMFVLYDGGRQVPRISVSDLYSDFGLVGFVESYKDTSGESIRNVALDEYPCYYPSLTDVMNNPDEILGIPTDAILDISVTAWCPYRFTMFEGSDGDIPVIQADDGTDLMPYIVRHSRPLMPHSPNIAPERFDAQICFYDIGEVAGSLIARDNWDAHTLTLSEDEYVCGELNLRDANGNIIANIPRDYIKPTYNPATQGTDYVLSYKAQTYSDSTGLYTRVDVGQDGKHHIITFPEGKVPFVGDAWAEYRIREMPSDRQQLQNAKDMAWKEFGVGTMGAIADTGIALAFGGASTKAQQAGVGLTAAGGLVSSYLNTRLSIETAEREQAVTEMRQKGMAGTGYNTGYGISYCDNAFYIGAGFVILMPSRFNAAKAHEKGMMFGYNAGFVGDALVTNGYYQGTPYPIGSNFQPMNDEELRRYYELLENGVRIALI